MSQVTISRNEVIHIQAEVMRAITSIPVDSPQMAEASAMRARVRQIRISMDPKQSPNGIAPIGINFQEGAFTSFQEAIIRSGQTRARRFAETGRV